MSPSGVVGNRDIRKPSTRWSQRYTQNTITSENTHIATIYVLALVIFNHIQIYLYCACVYNTQGESTGRQVRGHEEKESVILTKGPRSWPYHSRPTQHCGGLHHSPGHCSTLHLREGSQVLLYDKPPLSLLLPMLICQPEPQQIYLLLLTESFKNLHGSISKVDQHTHEIIHKKKN